MEKPSVGIFWDFENVHPPAGSSGYEVVSKIREFVEPIGPISTFKAYLDVNIEAAKVKQQIELQSSGISIIHTPHNGKKEAADKILIMDLMYFALETSLLKAIVLITGDQDFHYATSVLRHKGHKIYIIHPQIVPPSGLAFTAHGLFSWQTDILKRTRVAPEAQSKPLTVANIPPRSIYNTEVCLQYPDDVKLDIQTSSMSTISEGTTVGGSLSADSVKATMAERKDDYISKLYASLNVSKREGDWWSFESMGLKGCGNYHLEPFRRESSSTFGSLDGCVNEIFVSFSNSVEIKPISKAADNPIRESALPPPIIPPTPDVQWPPDELTPCNESPAKIPRDPVQKLKPSNPSTISVATPLFSPIKPSANFEVLIKVLKQKGASTTIAVRQRLVRKALLKHDPLVFRGYDLHGELYFKKAEKLGLIRLTFGKTVGTSRQPHIIICPSSASKLPSLTQSGITYSPQPTISNTLANSTQKSSSASASTPSFALLIDILKTLGASSGAAYKQTTVGNTLLRQDPLLFKRSNTTRQNYLLKAEAAGIIYFTGSKNSVALCSKYR